MLTSTSVTDTVSVSVEISVMVMDCVAVEGAAIDETPFAVGAVGGGS